LTVTLIPSFLAGVKMVDANGLEPVAELLEMLASLLDSGNGK
jgi:hypothetical protein